MKRYPVLNIWVDDCTMEKALRQVDSFVKNNKGLKTVFASNPEKNYSVPENKILYESFRNADLLLPDGIGMVLAANFLHGAQIERVPGCELMQNICKLSADKGYKIFIYGAKEEVNKSAVEEIKKKYPSVKIAGRQNGYLCEEKMDDLIKRINESEAQILFLALGSPRQEIWISKYRHQLTNIKVCQGIGGTLDVLAGNVKRAPEFYCNMGLEWFYRLISEPKRIKRQAKLPLFAIQVLIRKFKLLDSVF